MTETKISPRTFDLALFITEGEAAGMAEDNFRSVVLERFGDLTRDEVAAAIETADFILRDRARELLAEADALDALYQAVEAESEMP